jgi:hypothetical protein
MTLIQIVIRRIPHLLKRLINYLKGDGRVTKGEFDSFVRRLDEQRRDAMMNASNFTLQAILLLFFENGRIKGD